MILDKGAARVHGRAWPNEEDQMGMILGIWQLRDETIERLVDDPPLVWRIIAPDSEELYEAARRAADQASKPGLLARLFGRGATPADPQPVPDAVPFALRDGEGVDSDLDKAWHGIHFLLTGSSDEGNPPLDFLIAGGRPVGDEDVGYGTARVFSAAETRGIADALKAISDEQLAARFDPRAMTAKKIYPDIWDRDPADDDTLGYVMEYVTTLRQTLEEALASGQGLMITLS
jgi:hypothetical protein